MASLIGKSGYRGRQLFTARDNTQGMAEWTARARIHVVRPSLPLLLAACLAQPLLMAGPRSASPGPRSEGSLLVASMTQDEATRVGMLITPSGGGVQFKLETVPGVHINPDAPATLSGGGRSARLDVGAGAFILPAAPPAGTLMQARFSLCDNANTWCKPVSVSFTFQPDVVRPTLIMLGATSPSSQARAGSPITVLHEQAPGVALKLESAHPMAFPGAIQEDAQAAFAKASAEGKLVLMDFYGVWCPPCQLLVAQGLGDPRARSLLEKVVVLQLDADRDTSWTLKSRYGVTGYPTTLLTNAQGEELGRYLGFEDADDFVLWLGHTLSAGKPLKQWVAARRAGDRSPSTLLGLARSLVALGLEEEAVGSYAEALPALIGPDAREARKALLSHALSKKKADDARVQARALAVMTPPDVSSALTLVLAGQEVASWSTTGAAAVGAEICGLGAAASQKLVSSPSTPLLTRAQALEVLSLEAEGRGAAAEARVFASQGADVLLALEKSLSGEGAARFTSFRGQLHSLLDLLEGAERLTEAEQWYKTLVAAWPGEFTWHFRYSALLENAKRLDEAAREASLARDCGYGDNRLRAVGRLARILKSQGKVDAARTLLTSTLDATLLPADPTVRTHRYVQQLKEQLAKL